MEFIYPHMIGLTTKNNNNNKPAQKNKMRT